MSDGTMPHRPRHRAIDQDEVATRMLPRVAIPEDSNESAVPHDAPVPNASPLANGVAGPDAGIADTGAVRPDAGIAKVDAGAVRPDAGIAKLDVNRIAGPDERAPANDMTAVIPKLPPIPPTAPAQPPASASPTETPPPEDQADAGDVHPKGVQVVPLRPVRTEEGYRSVYSDLTRRTVGGVARTTARGTGELLITFGLIVLLFAAYEVWGKAAIVEAHQSDLRQQLNQQWAVAPTVSPTAPSSVPSVGPKPADGKVIAALYIPRLNKHWVVVQGVTPADIRYAPGHYPDTAMPGQVGNFSMAGHRTPAIFWDLDRLKTGDPVVVETADQWYIYSVVQSHVVVPTAVQVVAPVPNQPGAHPTTAMLTMTTCNPKFDNYQRLVVHAELTRTDTHSAGRPPELGG